MTVQFENESTQNLNIDLEPTACRVIEAAADYMKCPYEFQVSLLITQSEQIHEMNMQFRGIDRPTDVLSFPMQDFETPGDFAFLEDDDLCADSFDPESGELLLGDIVINTERVLSQAEEFGHSVLREYAFLIAHSMLHLCGFDHETPEEAKEMEAHQEAILTSLGITRD